MPKKSKALQHLEKLILEDSRKRNPSVPEFARVVNTFKTAKPEARQLKRVELFLNLIGGCKGNIVDNKGTRIDNRIRYKNPETADQTVGSVEYRKSKIQNGISDTVNTIKGRHVSGELKRIYKSGRDTQSKVQKEYEAEVIAAEGLYVIFSSYEDFYDRIFWHIYKQPFISQIELNKLILK